MSVDGITIAAQIANFLVLVWLLRRFLYRPILDGIDAREAEIAARMGEAVKARQDAQAAQDRYQAELARLQGDASALNETAQRKAVEERDSLLAEARARIEREHKDWEAHLAVQKQTYIAQLHQAGADVLVAMTRKALTDLADETLEQRIIAHAATHLRPMAADLGKAADSASAVATTRAALPKPLQTQLAQDLRAAIPGLGLRFETDPAQAPGLVLRIGAAHVAWTVDSYLGALGGQLEARLAEGPPNPAQPR